MKPLLGSGALSELGAQKNEMTQDSDFAQNVNFEDTWIRDVHEHRRSAGRDLAAHSSTDATVKQLHNKLEGALLKHAHDIMKKVVVVKRESVGRKGKYHRECALCLQKITDVRTTS